MMREAMFSFPPFRALEPGERDVGEVVFSPSGTPALVRTLFVSDEATRGRDETIEQLSSVSTLFADLFGGSAPDPRVRSHNERRRALRERRRRLRCRAFVVLESIAIDQYDALVQPVAAAVFSSSAGALGPLSSSPACRIKVGIRNVGTWRSQPFYASVLATVLREDRA